MTGSDRRMRSKLWHLTQGRADAWQAARPYLTEREADALAEALNLDEHDRFHAERRATAYAEADE